MANIFAFRLLSDRNTVNGWINLAKHGVRISIAVVHEKPSIVQLYITPNRICRICNEGSSISHKPNPYPLSIQARSLFPSRGDLGLLRRSACLWVDPLRGRCHVSALATKHVLLFIAKGTRAVGRRNGDRREQYSCRHSRVRFNSCQTVYSSCNQINMPFINGRNRVVAQLMR